VKVLYRPELLYSNGAFRSKLGLLVDDGGHILAATEAATPGDVIVDLPGKALLPGFVNAHSHSFQRLIRGKAESRATSGKDFWSWRGRMYHAAAHLDPQGVYDVARMAFLEMVLAGTTTVGEFHYLHTAPGGRPYDDPNLLSKQVIEAARSVGIRIVLLRCAYLRSGFQLPRVRGQNRFYETTAEFLVNADTLGREFSADPSHVSLGVAPHSVRAVPSEEIAVIAAWGRKRDLPVHMHVSEQPAENEASIREHGLAPVALLEKAGLLGPNFTAVHAIHIGREEIEMLAHAEATICSCPTTERNLGDGVIAIDQVMQGGIHVALGSDSQAQIDPLEDARELDYHLRLTHRQRVILDEIAGQEIAERLFRCATANGARSLSVRSGELAVDSIADFFTVDLEDPSIAGHSAESLLAMIVFGLNRSAIRDVAVNGRLIVRDGKHPHQEEIVSRYTGVYEKVWRDTAGGVK
jgi:formimidoylglutamate deiminase